MAAIQRQNRQQIEQEQEEVQRRGKAEEGGDLGGHRLLHSRDLASKPRRTDDRHRRVNRPLATPDQRLIDEFVDADRQRQQGSRRSIREVPHIRRNAGDRLRLVLEHRCHPEEADLFDLFGDLSVLVVDRSLNVGDGQRQGHLTAVALHDHLGAASGVGADPRGDVLPR